MGCKLSPIFFLSFLLIASLLSQIPYVKADSTFGKTDIGGTTGFKSGWNQKHACRFQAPEDGTITKITAYVDGTAEVDCYGIVYNDSSGAPDALLDVSDVETMVLSFAWLDFDSGLSVSITSGDYYWIGLIWAGTQCSIKYDAGSGSQFAYRADGPPPDNPFGAPSYEDWNMSIYATYTPLGGQELTFKLFENFNAFASTSKTMEISNTLFQAFNTWDSLAFNKEVGFKLYEPFNLWSYLDTSKEQAFTFFQPFNLWSSMEHTIETAYQDLYFTLFETTQIWSRLATAKEQAFSLFENFNLWSSLSHVTEGVALDLYFTFFESFNAFASLGTTLAEEISLNDVYGLAALGFILAIVGICLAVAFKKK